MPKLKWGPDLSVYIRIFDEEHQKLIELIDLLIDTILLDKEVKVVNTVVDEFIKYARAHFKREEDAMQACSFPEFAQHKEEHVQFVDKVIKHKLGFESHIRTLKNPIIIFITEWLQNHIINFDRKYSDLLKKRGYK